jgi:hypothetical protein
MRLCTESKIGFQWNAGLIEQLLAETNHELDSVLDYDLRLENVTFNENNNELGIEWNTQLSSDDAQFVLEYQSAAAVDDQKAEENSNSKNLRHTQSVMVN